MLGKTVSESKDVPCQSFSWLNRKPRQKIKAAVCSLSLHIGNIFSIAAAKSSFDAALEGVHRAEPGMRPHCIPWRSGKGRPSKKPIFTDFPAGFRAGGSPGGFAFVSCLYSSAFGQKGKRHSEYQSELLLPRFELQAAAVS